MFFINHFFPTFGSPLVLRVQRPASEIKAAIILRQAEKASALARDQADSDCTREEPMGFEPMTVRDVTRPRAKHLRFSTLAPTVHVVADKDRETRPGELREAEDLSLAINFDRRAYGCKYVDEFEQKCILGSVGALDRVRVDEHPLESGSVYEETNAEDVGHSTDVEKHVRWPVGPIVTRTVVIQRVLYEGMRSGCCARAKCRCQGGRKYQTSAYEWAWIQVGLASLADMERA